MRVHWLQHAAHETLGCIGPWLQRQGWPVTCTRLFAGERLPSPQALDWLLVLGGPMNIYEYPKYPWLRPEKAFIDKVIAHNRQVLGICLGAQLVADVLGARTHRNAHTEIGFFKVFKQNKAPFGSPLDEVDDRSEVFHWHGDTFDLPPGSIHHHKSDACVIQSFSWGARVLGVQFHLEVRADDARRWLQLAKPAPQRYVQHARRILARPSRFAANHRQMIRVLERMTAGTT